MPNSIKYSEGSETLALNKGNWWIGTGDSNKGPTEESGYWNAINPPSGGYTVYLNKETNGPSIHSITSDENLISFTNKISGQNYTTVAECLEYYQTQDDKLCVNREYENIVTDGLVLNLDAGYAPSYPTTGTTWYDLSGNGNDGTLVNGPTFDRDSGNGSLLFDGVDDRNDLQGIQNFIDQDITISAWINFIVLNGTQTYVLFHRPEKPTESLTYLYIYRNAPWDNGQLSFLCSYVTTGGTTSNLQHFLPIGFLNEGQWYNFTANYNSIGYSNFYVNGQLIVSRSPQPDFSRWVNINDSLMYSNRINGLSSNFQIYNRALTEQEVLQNYNAQKGRFGL